MAGILRGEIRWADLDPVRGREQAGRRPVLIVSHDVLNARSGTAIALALTRRPPKVGYPLAVPVRSVRLPKPSWVKTNQVRTLSTERFAGRLGRVSDEELQGVVEALRELID